MVKTAAAAMGLTMIAGDFYFQRLVIDGIDNRAVLAANKPEMAAEETCLFHPALPDGNACLRMLQDRVATGIANRRPLPVVRFADGEYAFYALSLDCNGLYRQAESVAAIRAALPFHVEALTRLSRTGLLAPLVFPGNIEAPRRGLSALLRGLRKRPSATTFLTFLQRHDIPLTGDNYLPFYVVYAWLSSPACARLLNRKKVCLIGSDWNRSACEDWFARRESQPELSFVEIPTEYVATRWPAMKESILGAIPADAEICLAGAGIGALPLCVDVAAALSIPVLDAGHVFNMMNDRVDKSNGARLYTTYGR
ncbi:MAG TPA: hypothetical protein PLF36_01720 [Syntrophales bacterium]|nr:hypothetical protein [Syntrophales bacterium]